MIIQSFRRDATGVWILADPDSDLDYGVALKDWLTDGETIADAEWIVPAEIGTHDELINVDPLIDRNDITHPAGTVALVWLRPDTALVGADYLITCRFTTTSTPPRIDDRSFRLRITER